VTRELFSASISATAQQRLPIEQETLWCRDEPLAKCFCVQHCYSVLKILRSCALAQYRRLCFLFSLACRTSSCERLRGRCVRLHARSEHRLKRIPILPGRNLFNLPIFSVLLWSYFCTGALAFARALTRLWRKHILRGSYEVQSWRDKLGNRESVLLRSVYPCEV
jgi:hypothetical protein